jgi:hypothetical protein
MASPVISQRRRRGPASLVLGRDVGIVYAAVVLVVSVAVALQGSGTARAVVRASSTNLTNMREQPLTVLALSLLIVSPLYYLILLIPVVLAYGAVQRWLGRVAVVIVVLLGHVGASLAVTVAETVALQQRWVPATIADKSDVGVSYGLAAALGLLLTRVPSRFRLVYGLASLAVVIALIVFRSPFSAIGHGLAWFIGIALAWLVYAGERAGSRAKAAASTSDSKR